MISTSFGLGKNSASRFAETYAVLVLSEQYKTGDSWKQSPDLQNCRKPYHLR